MLEGMSSIMEESLNMKMNMKTKMNIVRRKSMNTSMSKSMNKNKATNRYSDIPHQSDPIPHNNNLGIIPEGNPMGSVAKRSGRES